MNLYEALDQIGRKTAQEFWELWKREHAHRPEAEARAWVDKWSGPLAGRTKQERVRALELRVASKLRDDAGNCIGRSFMTRSRRTAEGYRREATMLQQVADVVEFGP